MSGVCCASKTCLCRLHYLRFFVILCRRYDARRDARDSLRVRYCRVAARVTTLYAPYIKDYAMLIFFIASHAAIAATMPLPCCRR